MSTSTSHTFAARTCVPSVFMSDRPVLDSLGSDLPAPRLLAVDILAANAAAHAVPR